MPEDLTCGGILPGLQRMVNEGFVIVVGSPKWYAGASPEQIVEWEATTDRAAENLKEAIDKAILEGFQDDQE